MPHSRPLQTIRKQLQEQLVDDLAAALKSLQTLLPENSEKHLLVLSLLGRLHDVNKSRLRNTLSNDDLQREYDRIRADLLDLVQGLEEVDFDPTADSASAASARASAAKQGSVLYRIPHVMPLEKETRCVVRIALNEDAIVENISLDEHVQLKSLYRVSDTMQAEITDPSGGRVFHIRSTSEPAQIIDKQGYTEWRFYVTPHVEGAHPLEVKVSIIEMKDGQPHRKELVLEETVEVVAESPVPDDAEEPMKTAGYTFHTSVPVAYTYEMTYERSLPEPRSMANRGLRSLVFFLAFLATGLTTTWALTPADTWAWWLTPNNPKALQTFIEKHPDSKHKEKAVQALAVLEDNAIKAIQQNPTAPNIYAFLDDFSESLRLEEVKRLVDAREDLKQELQPAILRHIEQRDRHIASLIRHPSFFDFNADGDVDFLVGEGDGSIRFFKNEGSNSAPIWKMIDDSTYNQAKIDSAKVSPEKPDSARFKPIPAPVTPSVKAIKPDMVFVKGGAFKMGSENGGEDEKPVHEVTLSDFYIGKYEVTFDEYDRFCEATGRKKPGDEGWGRGKRPVIYVSWFDAVAYCNWLSEQEGLSPAYTISGEAVALRPQAKGYRLPTEAEWEYAARGGNKNLGCEYSGSNELDDVGWYDDNAGSQALPVGGKKANELGVYDMSGNVFEWCGDWYGNYSSGSFDNPAGRGKGVPRVVRGGSCFYDAVRCRPATRGMTKPDVRHFGIGFRLVLPLQ